MKKIIPFKKEIIFKTNLAEITSISLEHSLHKESDHLIAGSFSLNGEYKITDTSTNTESFSYELPFDIHIEDHYLLDNSTVDIDDFYYEIVNENVLSVSIDVKVDKLEEKPLVEEKPKVEERKEPIFEQITPVKEETLEEIKEKLEKEEREEETVKIEEQIEVVDKNRTSLFGTMDESETYMTYRVYIIREGDSIDNILARYEITKEELASYNDLSDVKLGDKLIIPAIYHAKSE
ncbi:MAG: LysM peptidoglycan-binding domain-containing protein [Bacilli bacterium]|nr:LysM peptidoglycan-binding domain-containing protein [Bacilli bacterium]